MHGTVMEVKHGNDNFISAFVGAETKTNFRCRSARIIWLVSLSREMWDFAPPYTSKKELEQRLYFYNFIAFAKELFEKWKKLEVRSGLHLH